MKVSRLAANLTVSATAALLGMSAVADPPTGHGVSSDLTRIEEILRQTGASNSELAKFEDTLRQASAADLIAFADYLQKQSPAERAAFLEDFRLNAQYVPGPDSKPQPGVPQGKTFEFTFEHSNIFPGTTRKITGVCPCRVRR
jgi:hypothetical protein